jgi:hypothetical protein
MQLCASSCKQTVLHILTQVCSLIVKFNVPYHSEVDR